MGKDKGVGKSDKVIFEIDKEKDFSQWFTEIIKTAELADLRYNVKGFIVFRPWSVLCMKQMYRLFEAALERRGHQPAVFPLLIPESNFLLESEHIEGFAPEVFWVTEHGAGEKFEERLAIRPTSETAMYKMYSLWVRSYNDLPLKIYQSVSVCRHETKATRPFLRSREFLWIEAHDVFATEKEAFDQVQEDMRTTEEVMHKQFGIPFIYFRRPQWDKFPGAVNTYAADTLMPDGKVIQQPSTHMLGQNFARPFNIEFEDRDGEKKHAWQTCYGPAISRIFASVIAWHGDNKGLVFPFEIAPVQIVVIPIREHEDKNVGKKCRELKEKLRERYRVELDASDKRPGEKYYYWEMKGVPLRIELGPKDLKKKELVVFRRDTGKKDFIKEKDLDKYLEKASHAILKSLLAKADKRFKDSQVSAKSVAEVKKGIEEGKIVQADFCSIEKDGAACAEIIEKSLSAKVLGAPFGSKGKGECVVCGKKAKETVFIGKLY